jgi:Concanavalin A-like lectin/glucanases superfamily/Glycine-rich domain
MPTDRFITAGAFQWTPPAGVIQVTIELWGGGGGGAGGTSSSAYAGGGGGGEYARWDNVPVTPLTAYNGTIGAAGTGTTGNGNNGGQTSVTIGANTYVADNGDGGKTGATAAAATGGAGGTVTHTPAATQAVAGATGAASGSTIGGGGGQSGGPGGAGTNPTTAGAAGLGNTTTGVGGYSSSDGGAGSSNTTGGAAPAASGTRTTGGGGGGAYRSSSSRTGGAGTKGWATFTYTLPITLVVQNATHGEVSDAPIVTQTQNLVVQNGIHTLSSAVPITVQVQNLVVQSATNGLSSTGSVSQIHGLIISNSVLALGSSLFGFVQNLVVQSGTVSLVATFICIEAKRFSAAGAFKWTPPVGVTSVTIELWGGGGAGAGVSGGFGGGGGGGEYERWNNVSVTPLTTYSGIIGAGGIGGTGDGPNGGQTSIIIGANTYIADNGDGGIGSTFPNTATGGAGGSMAHSPPANAGIAGGTGATAVSGYSGGGGQSGGPGGNGTNPSGQTAGLGNTTVGVGGYSSSDGGAGAAYSGGGNGTSAPAATGTRTTGGGGGGGAGATGTHTGGSGSPGWAVFTYAAVQTLVVQNSTHVVSVPNITPTQVHNLGVVGATQVINSTNVVLTSVHSLAVQNSVHQHGIITVPTIIQVHNLSVANSLHIVTAQNIASTQIHNLTIQNAVQGLVSTNIVSTQTHVLTVGKGTHSLTSWNLDTFVGITLNVANAIHTQISAGSALTYNATIMADNPKSWWRLNELAGPTADDSGSAGDDATWTRADLVTFGQPGIPGSSDTSVKITSVSAMLTGSAEYDLTAVTVEGWIKASVGEDGFLIQFTNLDRTSYDRMLWIDSNGKAHFALYPNNFEERSGSSVITDGQEHHICGSVGAAGQHLYIDGIDVDSNLSVTSGQAFRGHWLIGNGTIGTWANPPSSTNLKGLLTEVAFYDTQLTPERIAAHYAAGIASGSGVLTLIQTQSLVVTSGTHGLVSTNVGSIATPTQNLVVQNSTHGIISNGGAVVGTVAIKQKITSQESNQPHTIYTASFPVAPAIGDLLIAFCGRGNSVSSIATPEGQIWTEHYNTPTSGAGAVQSFSHVVEPDEANSYIFTFDRSEYNSVILLDTDATGIDQVGTNNSGTTPELTDVYSGDLAFIQAEQDAGSGLSGALPSWTTEIDYTQNYHENILWSHVIDSEDVPSQSPTGAYVTAVLTLYKVTADLVFTQGQNLSINSSNHVVSSVNISLTAQSSLFVQNTSHKINQANVYVSLSGFDANIWTGTSWKVMVIKVYRGSGVWATVPIKRWNNKTWVTL